MPLTMVHPLPRAVQTPDPRPAARAQAPPRRAGCWLRRPHGASCSPGRRPRCRSHFLRSLSRSPPATAPVQAARPERAAGKDGARRGGSCAQPASGAGKEGTSPRQAAGGGTGLERRAGGSRRVPGGPWWGLAAPAVPEMGWGMQGSAPQGLPAVLGWCCTAPAAVTVLGGGAETRVVPLPPLPGHGNPRSNHTTCTGAQGHRVPVHRGHTSHRCQPWGHHAASPCAKRPPAPAQPGPQGGRGQPLAQSGCHQQGGGGCWAVPQESPDKSKGEHSRTRLKDKPPSHCAGSLGPAGLQ